MRKSKGHAGSGSAQAGAETLTEKDGASDAPGADAGGSKPTPGLFRELQARGLVQDTSNPDLGRLLDEESIVVYCGFDPTSDSLQLGNLVPLITLARFQRFGHQPIVVLGGGTGMIGDPSGRSDERNLLDEETIARNVEGQRPQFAKVLDFDSAQNSAIMVNNADWLTKLNLIDFLRDVGKSFSVNVMMSRESVKQRIAAQSGLSFTEFSYQILQAYDFFHLYREYGCRLQVGGSDQYGNILAGVDYIRRRTGHDHGAAALTFPLVQSSTGEKLGKTAAGALWLAPERTWPYEWYQYWFNVSDADAVRYLKFFTFLELGEIAEIESEFQKQPKERLAQRTLAGEMTRLIHGPEEAEKAERVSEVMFALRTHADKVATKAQAQESAFREQQAELNQQIQAKEEERLAKIAEEFAAAVTESEQVRNLTSLSIPRNALVNGYDLADALVSTRLANSKSEAKRLIRQGAVSLNGARLNADKRSIVAADIHGDGWCLVAAGPRRRAVVRFSD